MTRVLGKIKLSEVSLVDVGAGEGVDVKLLKRANTRAAARRAALDRFHRRVAKAQSEAVDRGEFILRYSKARRKFDEELEDLAPAKVKSKEGKKSRRANALSHASSANLSPNPRPVVIGQLEGSYDPTARPRSALRSFSSISKAADDNTIYDTICALATARQRPNETPESAGALRQRRTGDAQCDARHRPAVTPCVQSVKAAPAIGVSAAPGRGTLRPGFRTDDVRRQAAPRERALTHRRAALRPAVREPPEYCEAKELNLFWAARRPTTTILRPTSTSTTREKAEGCSRRILRLTLAPAIVLPPLKF